MDKITPVLLLLTLYNAVLAVPLTEEFLSSKQAKIVKYENESDGSGNYKFSFETSDGIRREETGTLINQGQPNEYIAVEGSYSYTRPDGEYEEINYTADLNGYKLFKKTDEFEIQVIQALPNAVVASLLASKPGYDAKTTDER